MESVDDDLSAELDRLMQTSDQAFEHAHALHGKMLDRCFEVLEQSIGKMSVSGVAMLGEQVEALALNIGLEPTLRPLQPLPVSSGESNLLDNTAEGTCMSRSSARSSHTSSQASHTLSQASRALSQVSSHASFAQGETGSNASEIVTKSTETRRHNERRTNAREFVPPVKKQPVFPFSTAKKPTTAKKARKQSTRSLSRKRPLFDDGNDAMLLSNVQVQNLNAPADKNGEEIVDDSILEDEDSDDEVLLTSQRTKVRRLSLQHSAASSRQIEAQERARLTREKQKTPLPKIRRKFAAKTPVTQRKVYRARSKTPKKSQQQQQSQSAKLKAFEAAKHLFSPRPSKRGNTRQQQQSKRMDARMQKRDILMSNIKENAGMPSFAKSTASARGKSRKPQSVVSRTLSARRPRSSRPTPVPIVSESMDLNSTALEQQILAASPSVAAKALHWDGEYRPPASEFDVSIVKSPPPSDDGESEDEEEQKEDVRPKEKRKLPRWVGPKELPRALRRQLRVDPDPIFGEVDLKLLQRNWSEIFPNAVAAGKERLKKPLVVPRDEIRKYKETMNFKKLSPERVLSAVASNTALAFRRRAGRITRAAVPRKPRSKHATRRRPYAERVSAQPGKIRF